MSAIIRRHPKTSVSLETINELDNCYLTISLGEPYQGNVYKLIAAVIED